MSRDDGFAVADMDSAYFDDAKMRDLWQRIHDTDRMARAVILHAATLLASWRQGERVTVNQAAPLWMIHDADCVADLKAVKMLDKAGRIPIGSWARWFGTAYGRREVRREIGRAGGLASGKSRSTDGEAVVQPDSTGSEPVRPSVPTVPSDRAVRPSRVKRNGLKALTTTSEEAVKWLDAEYAAGRLDADEYHRQRDGLTA